MNKQTEKAPAPASSEPVAAKKKLRPTAEQLQQITRGGRYTFNPDTGKVSATRMATKPAALGAKQESK